jgi:hypothetical protein
MIDKVIFLDIDGVLNVNDRGRDEFGSTFHKHFEDNLKWIIDETNAKIVISSSWRLSGLSVMQEMWKERGLAGEVIDITPNLTYGEGLITSTPRGKEVKEWLKDNPTRRYVIIDDDTDFLTEQSPFFVQTSENQDHEDCVDIGYGLTKKCSEKVIQILNN